MITHTVQMFDAARCAVCGHRDFVPLYGRLHVVIGFRYGRCRHCGLVQHVSEALADEFADEFYRTRYYALPHKRFEPDSRQELFNELLQRLDACSPHGRLLDVGAGTGVFVMAARQAGWDAEGLEISPTAADTGRLQYGVPMHCGTLADLEARALHRYRCITFWNILDQIPDPVGALRSACALLDRPGLIAVRVPNGGMHHAARSFCSVVPHAVRKLGLANLFSVHPLSFTPRTLRALLTNSGLVDVRVLNSPPSFGDPSGRMSRDGQRVFRTFKRSAYLLANAIHGLSSHRLCWGSSLLAFGSVLAGGRR